MTNNTIKDIIIRRSVPEYIQQEYPLFVSFLKAFIDYLEQEKYPIDIIKNLRNYRDSDSTLQEFDEYFRKEYLNSIPEDIVTDKLLLLKHIKEFYINKGNEDSYKFLFKLLFNENIEFYYPKVDVLRASDGDWYEPVSIKITISDIADLVKYNSNRIVGETSNASAIVENALLIEDRGENVVELFLSNVKGIFQSDENILIVFDDETIINPIQSILTNVTIVNGGSGYQVNDRLPVKDIDDNIISNVIVTSTSLGAISSLIVTDGGINYNGRSKRISIFGYLPGNQEINGDNLLETPLDGSDSNSSGENYLNYTFDQVISDIDITGLTGDPIFFTDGESSDGSGARGVVSLVDDFGTILEVLLLEIGSGYSAPTATVVSDTGSGAIIDVVGGAGGIAKAKLENFPIVLETDYDSNGDLTITIDETVEGNGDASLLLNIGSVAEYPGEFLSEDGFLSSNKRLQDNEYYQDFSYVLKTGLPISEYRDIIKDIVHPAGLALFGGIQFLEEVQSTTNIVQEYINIRIIETVSTAQSIEDSYIKFNTIDSNGDKTPILDSDGNHLPDYLKDSNGEYI